MTCSYVRIRAKSTVMTHARSFRFTCPESNIPQVTALLEAQGFRFTPEPFSPVCAKLTVEPFALGSSLAANFGLIYIQDRSSMLPPLLLAPSPGTRVLDMCSSPGGKSGFLAQLIGPNGFILANEPEGERLSNLRRNLFRLGFAQLASCGHDGTRLPFNHPCFDAILLDPPCSGWGTAKKNPNVMSVWSPDKVEPLINLQRRLLAAACALLKPGGRLLYSTCTTNPDENEEQTAYALDHFPLHLQKLTPPDGFAFHNPTRPELDGVLRVDEDRSEAQGFYLSAFVKSDEEPNREENAPKTVGQFDSPLPGPAVIFDNSIDTGGIDVHTLPDGMFYRFREKIFFLSQKAVLAPGLRIQGYYLGAEKKNRFRPHPRVRALVPTSAGPESVVETDANAIVALQNGQSRQLPATSAASGNLVPLYYDGLKGSAPPLALGFLLRKGNRLLWSDK